MINIHTIRMYMQVQITLETVTESHNIEVDFLCGEISALAVDHAHIYKVPL